MRGEGMTFAEAQRCLTFETPRRLEYVKKSWNSEAYVNMSGRLDAELMVRFRAPKREAWRHRSLSEMKWKPELEYTLRCVLACRDLCALYLLPSASARVNGRRPERPQYSGPDNPDRWQIVHWARPFIDGAYQELDPIAEQSLVGLDWKSRDAKLIPDCFVVPLLEDLNSFRSQLWAHRHASGMEDVATGWASQLGTAYPSAYGEQKAELHVQ